jgi:hypothetical protein
MIYCSNMADRPQSQHSSSTHTSTAEAAAAAAPAHQQWSAYNGPVLFTGLYRVSELLLKKRTIHKQQVYMPNHII